MDERIVRNNETINLGNDRLARPGKSPVGGVLFQECTEGGRIFLKPIPNTTTIGGSQLMATKLLGLEGILDANKTSLNEKVDNFIAMLDHDAGIKDNLLTNYVKLTGTRELFGVAFGLEGAGDYEIDKVHRYEKGFKKPDLLPLRFMETVETDNTESNYRAGYLLRTLENGTVNYYIKRLSFKAYNQVVGGSEMGTTNPEEFMITAGLNSDCETIIETRFTITGSDFADYFARVVNNHYARRISSVKILSGIPVDLTLENGSVVRDYRDIVVTNVIPLSTLNLGKDNTINFVYRIYI